jgi:hypothetical protein
MKRLLSAHRKSDDERDLPHIEALAQKPMLQHDIVVHGDAWEPAPALHVGMIARRRGQAVPEHIGDDDEVLVWVQRLAGPDHPFEVRMLGTERGWIDDDICARRIQRSECLVRQTCAAQNATTL